MRKLLRNFVRLDVFFVKIDTCDCLVLWSLGIRGSHSSHVLKVLSGVCVILLKLVHFVLLLVKSWVCIEILLQRLWRHIFWHFSHNTIINFLRTIDVFGISFSDIKHTLLRVSLFFYQEAVFGLFFVQVIPRFWVWWWMIFVDLITLLMQLFDCLMTLSREELSSKSWLIHLFLLIHIYHAIILLIIFFTIFVRHWRASWLPSWKRSYLPVVPISVSNSPFNPSSRWNPQTVIRLRPFANLIWEPHLVVWPDRMLSSPEELRLHGNVIWVLGIIPITKLLWVEAVTQVCSLLVIHLGFNWWEITGVFVNSRRVYTWYSLWSQRSKAHLHPRRKDGVLLLTHTPGWFMLVL